MARECRAKMALSCSAGGPAAVARIRFCRIVDLHVVADEVPSKLPDAAPETGVRNDSVRRAFSSAGPIDEQSEPSFIITSRRICS
jgi:hypothetical protein